MVGKTAADQAPADDYYFCSAGLTVVDQAAGFMPDLASGALLGVAACKLATSAYTLESVESKTTAVSVLQCLLIVQYMLLCQPVISMSSSPFSCSSKSSTSHRQDYFTKS